VAIFFGYQFPGAEIRPRFFSPH